MRQNINQEDFIKKLEISEEFYDEIFNFGNNNIFFTSELSHNIRFSNCSFTGNVLYIKDINLPDIGLCFSECVFKCKIEVYNCNLNNLWFLDTPEIEYLSLNSYGKELYSINEFIFSYNNKNTEIPLLEIDFNIKNYIFGEQFLFENVNMLLGSFELSRCKIGEKKTLSQISFSGTKFHNFHICKTVFKSETSFFKSKFYYLPEDLSVGKNYKFNSITDCDFEKVSFTNCYFNNTFGILNVNFNGSVDFHNVKNKMNGDLRIHHSVFNSYTYFDRASLHSVNIYMTQFNNITSFQFMKVNYISIDKTTFEKNTFFDEFNILKIAGCKRKTIRLIKQQLQKADNKIDYNRFRSYELSAYYRELKWFGNFKDKFILGLTWLATGFDHSWRRALLFTLAGGMLFYSLLYFIEFYIALNLNNEDNFTAGAFRFFLVTDFFSPFLDRKYLDNGYSWTVFILGKIVIAFGIYEMIQAFRKFKA